MIIAIDFDGTLCEDKYPDIGKPIMGMINLAKEWKEAHHTLILWTCRCGEYLDKAIEFCHNLGLEFDYINENAKEMIAKYGNDCRKVSADLYIDDRAVDWSTIENYI